jgi:DNA-binding MarR family transcriptional regulator
MMQLALRGDFDFRPVNSQSVELRQQGTLHRKGGSAEARWVRSLLTARAERSRFFSARLFADPAWDMLLELYAAELAQRRTSVTGLGSSSGVPPTTALRWMNVLEQDGLVIREDDPLDGRRVFIALSEKGSRAIRAYLGSLPATIYPFQD